jgi:Flp pilus assembly pilin Flp
MNSLVHRLLCEEDAQDIIEYAFLAAFISVVAYAIVVTIGDDVVSIYNATQGTTTAAAGAAGAAS